MLMNKKGQIGPQGLEDLPMAVMAFMVAIASVIIFLNITSAHLGESGMYDEHKTGKRLAETLSGDMFKSEVSSSYGSNVLDARLIQQVHDSNPTLNNTLGSVEYGFWAKIDEWEFGEDPPNATQVYREVVTVLSEGILYNGEVIVKIWRR